MTTRDELMGNLPLQYFDGPDYCTVKDATGGDFALTLQPELLKEMEAALTAAAPGEQQPAAGPTCRCHDDVSRKYCLDKGRCTPIAESQSSTSAPPAPGWDEAIGAERERCAAIVQMARSGEIDTDFRAIISIIEGGMTLEQIKEFCS